MATNKTDKSYSDCISILQEELLPAMGCTEPIAISYCASVAKKHIDGAVDRVLIEASGNIIKNVKSVVVPNTSGLCGIPAAAAVGIVAGRPEKQLEVIAEVTEGQKMATREFLMNTPITVELSDSPLIFNIVVTLYSGKNYSKVRIANYHTNIVLVEKDGIVLERHEIEDDAKDTLTDRSFLTVKTIYDFAESVNVEDIHDIIERQINYNTAIAKEGIEGNWGANIGSVLLKTQGNDVRNRAKAMAAAGSDARMSGCELPVIINSGSGNQGITVSVPVVEYAKELNVGEEKMYRALVLSNLIAIHQKTEIGRLSAFCGAINAGAAAGAAIAYLQGGDLRTVNHTLVNALAIVSGIVCDGAKASCAGKIASAVDAGLLGYEMFQNGQQIRGGDGIVKKGVEEMIKSVSRLGRDGMKETDKEILRIMLAD